MRVVDGAQYAVSALASLREANLCRRCRYQRLQQSNISLSNRLNSSHHGFPHQDYAYIIATVCEEDHNISVTLAVFIAHLASLVNSGGFCLNIDAACVLLRLEGG